MWLISFLAAIWVIWKESNRRCFEGKSFAIEDILDSSLHTVASWVFILLELWGLHIGTVVQNWKDIALFWVWLLWFFILLWSSLASVGWFVFIFSVFLVVAYLYNLFVLPFDLTYVEKKKKNWRPMAYITESLKPWSLIVFSCAYFLRWVLS